MRLAIPITFPPQHPSFYKLIQKIYINYYYVMITEVVKTSKKSFYS